MNRLALRLPLLAPLLAVLAPDSAHATDFCVAPNTTCGGTNVPTLPAALAAADNAADSDRVFLGDATYTAPAATGFDYNAPTFPVEIIGAGADKTRLTGPAGASGVLRLQGGPGSSIHDLAVVLPQNVAANAIGLDLSDPALRLTVTAHPTQANSHRGIVLRDGASIADATLTLSQDIGSLVGILVAAPSASIARSTIVARTGVNVSPGRSATVDRITATSSGSAVIAVGGAVTVTSSVLRPIASGAGLVALDQPGTPGSAGADGVTILGDGSGGTAGVMADEFQGSTATVTLKNSIIRGVTNALTRVGDTGTANVTATFSDFDPSTSTENSVAGNPDSAGRSARAGRQPERRSAVRRSGIRLPSARGLAARRRRRSGDGGRPGLRRQPAAGRRRRRRHAAPRHRRVRARGADPRTAAGAGNRRSGADADAGAGPARSAAVRAAHPSGASALRSPGAVGRHPRRAGDAARDAPAGRRGTARGARVPASCAAQSCRQALHAIRARRASHGPACRRPAVGAPARAAGRTGAAPGAVPRRGHGDGRSRQPVRARDRDVRRAPPLRPATYAGVVDRSAIVTGAASGIGHAVAQALVDAGAQVLAGGGAFTGAPFVMDAGWTAR